MRVLLAIVMVVAAGLVLTGVEAGEKKDKEVTLKGTITCAKCDLKVEKKCATVIVVKQDKKDVVYYFDDTAGKKNHQEICQASKPGSVTGTVKDDGKKKTITVKTVKFD
jgi:hypothetical protein